MVSDGASVRIVVGVRHWLSTITRYRGVRSGYAKNIWLVFVFYGTRELRGVTVSGVRILTIRHRKAGGEVATVGVA